MTPEAFKEFQPWIFHKPSCRCAAVADQRHDKCNCGLAEKLAAINAPDPRN